MGLLTTMDFIFYLLRFSVSLFIPSIFFIIYLFFSLKEAFMTKDANMISIYTPKVTSLSLSLPLPFWTFTDGTDYEKIPIPSFTTEMRQLGAEIILSEKKEHQLIKASKAI